MSGDVVWFFSPRDHSGKASLIQRHVQFLFYIDGLGQVPLQAINGVGSKPSVRAHRRKKPPRNKSAFLASPCVAIVLSARCVGPKRSEKD